MKRAFRLLGLTAAVTLAALSTAHAASTGTCRIHCNNGTNFTGPTTGPACCQMFQTLCDGDGTATWTQGIVTTHCPV